MKYWPRTLGIAAGMALLAAAVLLAPEATAQTGGIYSGIYSLRATIASGGVIAGGPYRLNNAMAQSATGVSKGGAYELRGGIVPATSTLRAEEVPEMTPRVFLPSVQR